MLFSHPFAAQLPWQAMMHIGSSTPRAIANLHSFITSSKTRSDLDWRFSFLCMLALELIDPGLWPVSRLLLIRAGRKKATVVLLDIPSLVSHLPMCGGSVAFTGRLPQQGICSTADASAVFPELQLALFGGLRIGSYLYPNACHCSHGPLSACAMTAFQ